MQNDDKISLEDAYALQTPEDNVALYRHWAETYDVEFARDRGYQYPQILADIYARHSKPADTPVLDVGSGTGLVASALQEHHSVETQLTIDGVDISPEMLAVSRTKNVYRHLFEADLTQSIDLPEKQYGAVVSAGTFTHGHVGPEAAVGGPIGLLQDGDTIIIDAETGTIEVDLDEVELQKRRKAWKPRGTDYNAGAIWKYAQTVGSAEKGALTHPGGKAETHMYADI